MIAGTVYTDLVETMNGSGNLTYIKKVFQGMRYGITHMSMPCIMLEPTGNNELLEKRDMNQWKDVLLSVDIIVATYAITNPDKSIVGDDNYKGVLDIENDIRATLTSSSSLANNNVLDIRIQPTVFGEDARITDTKYPARVMVIPIEIMYRQLDGA